MTGLAKQKSTGEVVYPSSDGKPMAETEVHQQNMVDAIWELRQFFSGKDNVYVAGNMLMFYVQGDGRKHVSPDVFVVFGIKKQLRRNYLVWQEGKAPDLVIELTSASTKDEDLDQKFKLYRDVLKVKEYFLFDPFAEYLKPSLQGFRLAGDRYVKIRPIEGRLPSQLLGLQLERDDYWLRLFDPANEAWLLTPLETKLHAEAERDLVKAERDLVKAERDLAKAERDLAKAERDLAKAELAKEAESRELAEAQLAKEAEARELAEAQLKKLREQLQQKSDDR